MDPLSLISGGSGGITGPTSSASSDGKLSSPFTFRGGSNAGNDMGQFVTLGLVAVIALLVLKRGR